MKRLRLKNIINKSKEFSVDPFDSFKKSLPEGLIGENYRLKEAWKAYGSPKNYKEAIWNGLIQPIDEKTFKLPSIGYDEKADEYEYLNKGKDNEIVNKDIRVWDNDAIPLVKELKLGGYIRVYNEEKDCWTYSKNSQPKTEVEESEINSFKNGGKSEKKHWKKPDNWNEDKIPYEEWIADINPKYLGENYDLKTAYENFPKEMLERWKFAVNSDDPNYYMDYRTPQGEYLYHLGSIVPTQNGDYVFLKLGKNNPELQGELNAYYSGLSGLHWTHDLVFDEGQNRYFYRKKQTGFFKQGGSMNIIPDGALHARKNHMEGAGEDFTSKGIPVMSVDGKEQVAEIEKEEWTMSKELTDDVEAWYKKFYNDETSESDKNELAIKCGKRITEELLHNTDDRANLIAKIMEEE